MPLYRRAQSLESPDASDLDMRGLWRKQRTIIGAWKSVEVKPGLVVFPHCLSTLTKGAFHLFAWRNATGKSARDFPLLARVQRAFGFLRWAQFLQFCGLVHGADPQVKAYTPPAFYQVN